MSWPPQKGELWMAAETWEGDHDVVGIPGGAMVVILGGTAEFGPWGTTWWGGEVLGPGGKRWIKATPDDLIRGDDPRLTAQEFTRSV